jgi:hypothetical protein
MFINGLGIGLPNSKGFLMLIKGLGNGLSIGKGFCYVN